MKSFSNLPKISIVTVNLNHGHYLEHTIRSVLDQKYPNLEYMIFDGGSIDGSVEIIKKYESQLTYWQSGKDGGHHLALQQGLQMTTGKIMGWINADDCLMPGSLFALGRTFSANPDVKWITGVPQYLNSRGALYNYNDIASERWSKQLFLHQKHAAIQQESTFWRRELWEQAGGRLNVEQYTIAFDYELWCRFFRYEKLYTTTVPIGAFRITRGVNQQSTNANRTLYLFQCEQARKQEINSSKLAALFTAILFLVQHRLLRLFYFLNSPILKNIYLCTSKTPPVLVHHK
ncbi:MAG: glycosyltransferase [Bacteroidetes bacterium]|nr:glycosyltransferase [Bacteroidota bacterium]